MILRATQLHVYGRDDMRGASGGWRSRSRLACARALITTTQRLNNGNSDLRHAGRASAAYGSSSLIDRSELANVAGAQLTYVVNHKALALRIEDRVNLRRFRITSGHGAGG